MYYPSPHPPVHNSVNCPHTQKARPTEQGRESKEEGSLRRIQYTHQWIRVESVMREAMLYPHPISAAKDAKVHQGSECMGFPGGGKKERVAHKKQSREEMESHVIKRRQLRSDFGINE